MLFSFGSDNNSMSICSYQTIRGCGTKRHSLRKIAKIIETLLHRVVEDGMKYKVHERFLSDFFSVWLQQRLHSQNPVLGRNRYRTNGKWRNQGRQPKFKRKT